MRKAILLLPPWSRDRIYSPEAIAEISRLVALTDCGDSVGDLDALKPVLADAEIIITGWGMMTLDAGFLLAAPNLEAVIYGAGSVRYFLTDAFWERGILLTSAWAANAVPVVEYTLAAITFGLRRALQAAALTRRAGTFKVPPDVRGLYGAKVGVIGAGMVGAGVLGRLKAYDVETYCCDPYLCEDRALKLGTAPMGLDEMFLTCDVVTVHAASIPATEHMISGRHLRSMKDGAVFINTARGRIVREDEMIEVLQEGRIFAFIDVTDPEPPAAGNALYTLPNVFLTPHIAGALGQDLRRNGAYVLDELRRFLEGRDAHYPITKDMMEWMA
jgi:phosphoglycerate dehydrogenase-like enzyme